MAFYTIFSHSIKTSYKAKLFSESTLFYILCIICNILLPIVVIYKSDGLWRKIEFYSEQPDINFKHNLIVVLQLRDSGFKFWSSFPHLNQAFRFDQISVPFIRNREIDSNSDAKYDELNITLKFPIDSKDDVVGVQLILFFDYKLNTKIDLQMESLLNIEYNSPKAGNGVRVVADIKFIQKEPLIYRKRYIGLNDNLIGSQEVFIEDIVSEFVKRKFSTSLDSNTYYKWYSKSENSTHFQIEANIGYPPQTLTYRPGFWYLMKWALIQYLSIYLIIYFIIKKILLFVFENRLLNCIQSRVKVD